MFINALNRTDSFEKVAHRNIEMRINAIFVFLIFAWMVTPYLYRNISPFLLILFFVGWLFTSLRTFANSRNKFTFVFPIIWFFYIIIYRIFGYSSASWGNYYTQFFFWLSFFAGYVAVSKYDNRLKRILLFGLWLLSLVNIVDNIRLLHMYPNAQVYLLQGYLENRFVYTNIGDIGFTFYVAVYFLLNVLLLFRKNITRKFTYKAMAFIGCITSIVYLVLTAKAITLFLCTLVLFAWLLIMFLRTIPKNLWLFICVIVVGTIVILLPYLLNLLIVFGGRNDFTLRLSEISNLFFGTNYASVDSGEKRIAYTLISLNTWLSTPLSFVFGVGDGSRAATIETISSTFIGQHSEIVDCLARYGVLGSFLFYSSVFSCCSYFMRRIQTKIFFVWVYIIFFLFMFLNTTTVESMIGGAIFVLIPLTASLIEEKNDKELRPNN